MYRFVIKKRPPDAMRALKLDQVFLKKYFCSQMGFFTKGPAESSLSGPTEFSCIF